MIDALFMFSLTVLVSVNLLWGFRSLPKEKWQILAALPCRKHATGTWSGRNLTFYGLFNANAYTLAATLFIILMCATGAPLPAVLILISAMIAVCLPASRLVARMVEKKRYTFTVGGASFVGILIAPFLVWGVNHTAGRWIHADIHPFRFLSAMAIAYAFGEGIGRLACISFGCCYGKPLAQCHPLVQRLFRKWHFVFTGETKKIGYAHGLCGQQVVPIQAITAVIYCAFGLAGVILFLGGYPLSAFFLVLAVTQVWRTLSEFFRADFRGRLTFSAYQIMGIASVVYALALTLFIAPPQAGVISVLPGLRAIWQPGMILFLQGVWILSFLYTGRSDVTSASLQFHVVQERI